MSQSMTEQNKWPLFLQNPSAVADYVSNHSPYEICSEQIEEMYIGCRARLRWTALNEIRLGPSSNNMEDETRQKICNHRPVETMPPLLVDDGQIMDGSHRFRSLMLKGQTHFWVYHIEDAPQASVDYRSSEPSP